jgi:peptidyl-prolyl cis-trans isomerase A (cyclophilin A)
MRWLILLLLLAACKPAEVAKMDTVILETTEGKITVELYRNETPATVENFLSYVKQGHYDGTIFHRIIPDFMVQGGGFIANGTQKQTMQPIKLEAKLPNKRGMVSMARTLVPDSATSQFFINTVDNPSLDPSARSPGYTVFGRVVSGMDVVDRISVKPTKKSGPHDDWPVEPVIIQKAYVG